LFGQGFQIFIFTFEARSTQLLCFFQDTRPSAAFPVIVRSNRRKLRPRRSLVSGASLARAREPFALWSAWRPRSAFSGHARCWMGSTVVDLRLGSTGDGACPPRVAVSNGIRCCLYCQQPFFGFFLLCVVYSSCFLRYKLSMYCSNFIGISVG